MRSKSTLRKGQEKERSAALHRAFLPEFLGRLDQIVAFSPLSEDALVAIAEKYLNQLKKRLESNGLQLQYSKELSNWLAGQCKAKDGARHLRRLAQEKVEGPLAEYLLRMPKHGSKIKVALKGDCVGFQPVSAEKK